MKYPLILLRVFCLLLLTLGGQIARCQTDSIKLEEMSLKDLLSVKVTTASKTSEALEKTPATVLVITEEQIKVRAYQSLLDVIYDLPDMKVDDKIYSGIRNTVTLRGTQGQEKFIILLDGNRISSPSGEAMPIMENYPVNLAEQIEIVYGPASALYGADAVSGIINIITKKSVNAKGYSIDASSVAGNYGYINQSLFISKKLNKDINFIISGQYNYSQEPNAGKLYPNDSLLTISGYSTGTLNTIFGPFTPVKPVTAKYEAPMEAYNICAALHIDNFSFTFFRNYFKIPTAFGNNTSNAVYNKEVFMAQSIDMANASYKKLLGKLTTATSITASEYKLDPKSNYRNLYTSMEPAYKYSVCSMIKGEEQIDYKVNPQLNFTGGISYESYYSVPQSTDLEAPVNVNDYIHGTYLGTDAFYRPDGLAAQFYLIRYHNTGTYFQMQYAPTHKINLTLGARYDVNSRYGSSLNPRVGIVYKASEKTIIKALYGTAFLAPSPADSYSQYGSFDTQDSGRSYHSYFLHLPNPSLKPITSQNVEMSISQYFTRNLSVTIDGYYTVLKGLHAFADDNASTHLYNNQLNGIPVDYIEVFINKGRQQTRGGSIQLNWKKSIRGVHINSYASFSYVNGKVDDPNTESDPAHLDTRPEFISPVMFHIGTDITTKKLSFAPRLILMGKQNLAGAKDTVETQINPQTLPGYALLNISMRYNITKRISIFANITNALNQHFKNVSFNMDLNKKETELFYGQRQDPIRIRSGVNFAF
ncbi:MAG: TonB-dependent receptor [Ferruginibacter sp.]